VKTHFYMIKIDAGCVKMHGKAFNFERSNLTL